MTATGCRSICRRRRSRTSSDGRHTSRSRRIRRNVCSKGSTISRSRCCMTRRSALTRRSIRYRTSFSEAELDEVCTPSLAGGAYWGRELEAEIRTLTAGPEHERKRLDQFVAANLAPEYSRSQVARMIKAGLVTLNGGVARASAALRRGDRVEIKPPPAPAVAPVPAPAPEIEVLFADSELIVVNKPARMTVHPAPGHPHSTLVDALMARFPDLATMVEPDGVVRPGIVHRLDKETSGVMVVARTPFARTALSRQFKERTVRKIYVAVVRGRVARDRQEIARALGRHPTERKRMSVRSRNPREAISHATVL